MCSGRALCRWLPVLFVIALIAWCYYVYTSDILLPMLRLKPGAPALPGRSGSHDEGVAYTIGFNVLFGVGMICFVCAVFTDPGRIPDAWAVGAEDTEAAAFFPQLQTLEKKQDGSRRVCRKSKPNMYKPDRAHFCKMLGRCVLKMDHFCPWLNNCIGFYNYKFFYLFILYMAALTIFMLVTMTPTFVNEVTSSNDVYIDFSVRASFTPTRRSLLAARCSLLTPSSSMPCTTHARPHCQHLAPRHRCGRPESTGMRSSALARPLLWVQMEFRVTLTYLIVCLLCVGLSCFLSFHTYLLLFNYSTIEFLEKRGCNPPKDHINRYHLGVCENVCAVLGNNPLVWLLPLRYSCEGDGLAYKLNPDWYPSSKGR